MISEQELAELSFADAPNIITDGVPGPKAAAMLAEAPKFESMTRGGGGFPLVFDVGKGVTVKDPDGNLYIDVSAGVGVSSVGRSHPRVIETMERQSRILMHASDISNTKRGELAKMIASIAPPGLRNNCISYFTQSGSGALECAIKFARRVTGRNQILAFHGAYHGVWAASNALTTGDQYRKGYGPFMGGVIHAPYPYAYRFPLPLGDKTCEEVCGDYVDYLLNTPYTAADDVAAVIVEPVQGEGGYVPPAPEFFLRVKAACEKHGALFVADEVQAGTGRTGKMWSIEHTGVEPDMMTFGKGMGGDLPMAGVIMRKELAQQLDDMSQPQTFAANAVSSAVTMTNIAIIQEGELVERAAQLGKEVLERLQGASDKLPIIGEARGRGLMIGIELVTDKHTREPAGADTMMKVVMGLLANGIIMVPCGRNGNVLRLMPSLTITRDYMNKAVDILLDVLSSV